MRKHRIEKQLWAVATLLCLGVTTEHGIADSPHAQRSAIAPLSRADQKLLDAAYANDLGRVKSAIEKGASVNCQSRAPIWDCLNKRPAHLPDITLDTPLLLALSGRALDEAVAKDDHILQFLLSRGANPNLANSNGFAPLFMAVRHSMLATRTLLDAGANPRARAERGDMILGVAAMHSKPETVKLLLARGAQVNEGGEFGFTPLDRAISQKKWENAEVLLAAGGKSGLELKTLEAPFISRFEVLYAANLKEFAAWKKRPNSPTTN